MEYTCEVAENDVLRVNLLQDSPGDCVCIECVSDDGNLVGIRLSDEDARDLADRILLHLGDPD